MGTEWSWDDDQGCWLRPIETMDSPLELWPDEMADFPPLVDALAEIERLRDAIRAHKLTTGYPYDLGRADLALWSVLDDEAGES